jgi:hypothetical protein
MLSSKMSSASSRSSSGNSSSSSFSAYDVTGFFGRAEDLPFVAGVAVFEAFAFAFAGVFLGVAFGVSAAFFLTGSVRLGLFELVKKSDVVVSSRSGSGVGSRLTFFAAGFLGVAFFGLSRSDVTSVIRQWGTYFTSSSSSSESSTTLLARLFFLGAAFFGSSFFCELWLPLGGPPPKKLRMSAGILNVQTRAIRQRTVYRVGRQVVHQQ